MKYRALFCYSAFLALLLAQTSCVIPRRLDRVSDMTGTTAVGSAPRFLVVERPFRHKASSFPAGRYQATVTDGAGVYYEAPDKVIQNALFGANTIEGGLYVPTSRDEGVRTWVSYGGSPIKVIGAVQDLSFHSEK